MQKNFYFKLLGPKILLFIIGLQKMRLTWGRLNQYLSLEAAKSIAVAGG
jgi:hypothetical protein